MSWRTWLVLISDDLNIELQEPIGVIICQMNWKFNRNPKQKSREEVANRVDYSIPLLTSYCYS